MISVPRILRDHRLWPLGVLVVVSLLLLPRLGVYGFWEPQEMDVAARALAPSVEEVEQELQQKQAREAKRSATEKALATLPPPRAWLQIFLEGPTPDEQNRLKLLGQLKAQERADELERTKNSRPPLADAMVERSTAFLGLNEFGARLPFVLLGLLTALATYFLGLRIRGPRTGLLAAVILVGCPLFVFQARQLTSELGTMAGATLMMLAAVGLCSPRKQARSPWLYALDGLLLFCGLGLAYYDSAFFVGVLAPVGAVALACAATLFADTGAGQEHAQLQRQYLRVVTALSTIVALLVLAAFVHEVFSWVRADDGEFSIYGHTLHASQRYQDLLGGIWRKEGDLNIGFNSLFEQIAFGLFPWVCLAPIAVARVGMGGERGTNPLGARLLFAWAALAWVVSSVFLRKVGATQYVAVPAIAVAIAIWLDELVDARANESGKNGASNLAPPLVALFVLFAGIAICKDAEEFPLRLLNVHLDTAVGKFPKSVSLHKPLVAIGLLFTLSLFSGLYFWRREDVQRPERKERSNVGYRSAVLRYLMRHGAIVVGRVGILGALALSLVGSAYLAQVWTPGLSTKLSSKTTFGVYQDLREAGNTLGIVGKATAGSTYYADGPFEELSGRPALIEFLARPERVFALVKSSELCPIHTESSKLGFDYYVVDDSNADKVILSNRMWNKAVAPPPMLHGLMRSFLDRNPLSRAIVRERPKDIQHPVSANFDNQIQLIGIDLPDKVDRGKNFEVTLYYEVLRPITRNWQIFLHFDGGGVRFQGDHYPVNDRCGTNNWQPGDFVVDRYSVDAGGVTNPKTNYTVWTGFFVGSAGNWENMKALSGDPDSNNRVKVGNIRLK